jgi:hypothetical protein
MQVFSQMSWFILVALLSIKPFKHEAPILASVSLSSHSNYLRASLTNKIFTLSYASLQNIHQIVNSADQCVETSTVKRYERPKCLDKGSGKPHCHLFFTREGLGGFLLRHCQHVENWIHYLLENNIPKFCVEVFTMDFEPFKQVA